MHRRSRAGVAPRDACIQTNANQPRDHLPLPHSCVLRTTRTTLYQLARPIQRLVSGWNIVARSRVGHPQSCLFDFLFNFEGWSVYLLSNCKINSMYLKYWNVACNLSAWRNLKSEWKFYAFAIYFFLSSRDDDLKATRQVKELKVKGLCVTPDKIGKRGFFRNCAFCCCDSFRML